MATRKRKRRQVEDDGVANDEDDAIPALGVFEAMENGRSQIIVHIAGSPGSGKTTLGNWISNNLKVPVIDTDDFINHGSKEGKELLQMSDKDPAAYKRRWTEILDAKFEEAIAKHALAPLIVFVGLLDHFGPPDNSYYFFRQATARYFLDVPLPQLLKQFYVRIAQDEKRRADAGEKKDSDEYWENVAKGTYSIPGAKDIVKNNATDVKWHKAHKYEMLSDEVIQKQLLALVQPLPHHDHEEQLQQVGPLIMRLSGVPGSGKTFVCTQLSKLPGVHCVDMDILSNQAYWIVRKLHPKLVVESDEFQRLWADEEAAQAKNVVVAATGNSVLVFAGVIFAGIDRTLNTRHKFFIKLEPSEMEAVYRRFLLREQAKFVDKDAQVKKLIQESKDVEALQGDVNQLLGALGPRSYVEFVDDYKTKVEEFSGLGYVVASQEDIVKHIQQLSAPYQQALDVNSMDDCQSCQF